VAQAATWACPDAEVRKRGERTGLDTRVVHAVNDASSVSGAVLALGALAHAVSWPPGDYERKLKTQRN
jgi:hypothetical protein